MICYIICEYNAYLFLLHENKLQDFGMFLKSIQNARNSTKFIYNIYKQFCKHLLTNNILKLYSNII